MIRRVPIAPLVSIVTTVPAKIQATIPPAPPVGFLFQQQQRQQQNVTPNQPTTSGTLVRVSTAEMGNILETAQANNRHNSAF